jgi:methionyl-tRNA formyltransferase
MDKVTLFAMTEKGYSVLASLLPRYSKMIDSVIAARDKNIVKDYFEEIAEMCRQHGVRFYNRTDTYKIRTKYVIAVSWRWLIQSDTTKVIVFHDSLLPRYRGFNPLVTALINGDA